MCSLDTFAAFIELIRKFLIAVYVYAVSVYIRHVNVTDLTLQIFVSGTPDNKSYKK